MELSEQDWEVILRLRREGCAVVVFLPSEMSASTAAPDAVEDSMTDAGWRVICETTPTQE